MHPKHFEYFNDVRRSLTNYLLEYGQTHLTETWHDKPGIPMRAVFNISYRFPITHQNITSMKPNQPWADLHHKERVSGEPLNPPPSHAIWPHAQSGNKDFRPEDKFSHTYPERFWPKHAGEWAPRTSDGSTLHSHKGIRFYYGDLQDVINLLGSKPNTRQAFLPVWFPEDTGSVSGQRVPCSLGYLFYQVQGHLHCNYYMRSCDFLLHWEDDMYLATQLLLHVLLTAAGNTVWKAGYLTASIANLHVAEANLYALGKLKNKEYGKNL